MHRTGRETGRADCDACAPAQAPPVEGCVSRGRVSKPGLIHRARGLPVLRLSGDPRARGLAHGRLATGLIAHNIRLYLRRFEEDAELPASEVLRRSARCWEALRWHSPEYAAMVEGVAEGCGAPLMEIVAMNLRYELLYSEFSRIGMATLGRAPSPAGECTAFAVLPEVARAGHLLMGQNWDWIPGVAGVVLLVALPSGHRVLCFSEAGIAGGKFGLNSAGVGLAVSGLLSDADDWSRLGRPFHVRTWEALCSTTLDEALFAAGAGPHSCSASFIIAEAAAPGKGRATNLEVSPAGTRSTAPRGGLLVHANHFIDPGALGLWEPMVEERLSTYHRHRRLEELLTGASARGPISARVLRMLLRDHDGIPESVCRHPNPSHPEGERYQTEASVIIDLHARTMQIASGPPCSGSYRRLSL